MYMKLAARGAVATAAFGMVVATMALAASTPARADTQIGLLNCRSAETTSYIVVSNQPLNCVFTPSAGGPVQYYQANLRRLGAQAGFNSGVTLGWAVFAPSLHVGPGALAGTYGGVSAGASFVVGAGANGLVGGNSNSFALQPVSVEGQSGFNVVATATEVELQAVVPARHGHHHH